MSGTTLTMWFEITSRGTSGDQVMDILYSWRADKEQLMQRIAQLEEKIPQLNVDLAQASMNAYNSESNVVKLTARIAELEAASRWIPVEERLPEEDSALNPEDCAFRFTGNSSEVYLCDFMCMYVLKDDQRAYKGIVPYNFETGCWELLYEGELIEATVICWQPLPPPPEAQS